MKKRAPIKFLFSFCHFWIGLFWDAKKHALYFFPVPMFGVRVTIWGRRCFVVRKRGLFYRPNACGYTDRIDEAGRYTFDEAKQHEYLYDERVTVHHVAEFLTEVRP